MPGRELSGDVRWSAWTGPAWFVEPVDSVLTASAASGEQVILAVTLALHARRGIEEGEITQVVLNVRDGHGATPAPIRLAFVVEHGDLREIFFAEEEALLQRPQPGSLDRHIGFQGVVLNSENMQRRIPTEYLELAERLIGEQTVAIEGALTATTPSEGSGDSSCSTSSPSSAMTALIILLLRWRKRVPRDRPTCRALGPRRALQAIRWLATIPLLIMMTEDSKAVQRCVVGVTAWWDGRTEEFADTDPFPDNSYPGFLLEPCDSELKECYPTEQDCCFTALHGLQVQLINTSTQVLIATTTSDPTYGIFTLCDNNWQAAYEYQLVLKFTHGATPPAQFSIKPTTGSGVYAVTVPIGQMTASPTLLGVVSPNSPGLANQNPPDLGDLSSFSWGLAQIWSGAWETFIQLEAHGEERIRAKFGSSNSFDQIDLRIWGEDKDDATCDLSRVRLNIAHNAASHELGHILIGRVLGCNGGLAKFPYVGPLVVHCPHYSAEGVVLTESLADLASSLISWDPAVASTANVVQKSWPCTSISFENDAVDRFNTTMGLWDLMDSASDYTDSWSDSVSVSIDVLLDALIDLSEAPGAPGANHSKNEQQFNDLGTLCTPYGSTCGPPTVGCGAGQVCSMTGHCIGGDPHGANIADLAFWLPGSYDPYWKTIESGQCIGAAKDSAPFTGGYRKL